MLRKAGELALAGTAGGGCPHMDPARSRSVGFESIEPF